MSAGRNLDYLWAEPTADGRHVALVFGLGKTGRATARLPLSYVEDIIERARPVAKGAADEAARLARNLGAIS